jgi:hypothetical protein
MAMNKAVLLGALLLLVASGCGDTPRSVMRDAILFQNEIADSMAQVNDEESADALFTKERKERLKSRWESLEKRMNHFAQDDDAKVKESLYIGAVETLDEGADTALRLSLETARLKQIKRQIGGGTTKALDELIRAPSNYQLVRLWSDNPFFKKSTMGGMPGGGMPGGGRPGGGMPGGGKMPPGFEEKMKQFGGKMPGG